jgi:hypothetical protein
LTVKKGGAWALPFFMGAIRRSASVAVPYDEQCLAVAAN